MTSVTQPTCQEHSRLESAAWRVLARKEGQRSMAAESQTSQKPNETYQMENCTLEAKERDKMYQSLTDFVDGLIRNRIDLAFARKQLDVVYITEILRKNEGNIGRAAKAMGVHRNTLSKRIKELKVTKPS